MNYVLQIDLQGADKTEAALDSLLQKVGKLSSGGIDFSMDKDIDKSGFLKQGEIGGEFFSEGVKKAVKKNLKGNWLGLSGEFGEIVKKSTDELDKFWGNAIKKGLMDAPKIKGLRETGGTDLAKVQALPDINSIKPSKADWKKILTGIFLGVSNPYVGSRLISDEMGKHEGGIAGGIFGKGGIAGFSEIFAAFKIFNISVKLFKAGADLIYASAERAKQLYAKSLQSGLGVGFTSSRMMAAKILGISESEVLRFGAALSYLNPKIKWASDIFTKTNPIMTELSWQTDILKENFAALVAKIGSDVAPTLIKFTNDLSDFVKRLAEHSHAIANLLGGAPNPAESRKQLNESFFGYHPNIMPAVAGAFGKDKSKFDYDMQKEMMDRVTKLKPGAIGVLAKTAGLNAMDTQLLKRFVAENQKPLEEKNRNGIPNIQSSMQKLSASSWEKMGLVVGQGSNTTHELMKKQVHYLKSIAEMMKGNAQAGNNRFGMDPLVANP